jgi:putative flippase GtrA
VAAAREVLWVLPSSTAPAPIAAANTSAPNAAAPRRRSDHCLCGAGRRPTREPENTALSLEALTAANASGHAPGGSRFGACRGCRRRIANLLWMRDEATTVDVQSADLDRAAGISTSGVGDVARAAGAERRPNAASIAPSRVHIRLLHAMRRPANWLQLIRFSIVGASGYAANLLLYALFVKQIGIEYLVAEAAAWIIAAGNNFVWNRHWTFRAGEGQVHLQALRFFLVSLAALALNLVVLRVLVESAGLDKVAAEVLALAASTPLSFLGNKLWSFRLDLYSESSPPREE